MASTEVQRKLTAILVSDVVGYSRLMGDNPEGTLTTLTTYRQVFSDKIKEFKGRVVNAPGDSLLAEFVSVLDAVSCAVEIQRELAERNQELPDTRRMDFRIGVTLGDVLVKEEALYGDGVNIAARLESLAEPGGICISGKAHTEVKNRLPLHFEYLGEQAVKNIAEPVKVYQVLSKPGAAAHRVVRAKRNMVANWRRAALVVATVSALAVVVLVGWLIYQKRANEMAGVAHKEGAALRLPEKPSIAVLAFDNLGGDQKQEYFSDGFTEDLITDLSKISGIAVVARNSSFRYKGKAVDARQVGEELGVAYILEGSIRTGGNLLRISAQLIDARTGNHLWAERYERKATELFTVQNEIVQRIVTALKVKLTMDEVAQVRFKTTDNVDAWGHYLRGQKSFRASTVIGMQLARYEYKKALALDSAFEAAMLGIGWTYLWEVRHGTGHGPANPQILDEAAQLASRAMSLNETLAEPYALLGIAYLIKGEHEKAVTNAERAATLEPNGVKWHMLLASNLSYAERPEEAVAEIDRALTLTPFPPDYLLSIAGRVYYQTRQYEKAIRMLEKLNARKRIEKKSAAWVESQIFLIASYSGAERLKEAHNAAIAYQNARMWKFGEDKEFVGTSTYLMRPEVYVQYRMFFKKKSTVDRLLADLNKVGVK
jgi:TolB-like protein/class 3 adenylate cyclase